ncbi:protein of unknown function [Pseudodesulfovibrio profundus]|uniref:Uncharacterized protein n=1 Tax=Pseudodesulfovibrio profundus TaxID=57320 RepID=A0A2C8FB05_9BACT|nr:protein of unknown function [Pseudodesulfovibrio profundus]
MKRGALYIVIDTIAESGKNLIQAILNAESTSTAPDANRRGSSPNRRRQLDTIGQEQKIFPLPD